MLFVNSLNFVSSSITPIRTEIFSPSISPSILNEIEDLQRFSLKFNIFIYVNSVRSIKTQHILISCVTYFMTSFNFCISVSDIYFANPIRSSLLILFLCYIEIVIAFANLDSYFENLLYILQFRTSIYTK